MPRGNSLWRCGLVVISILWTMPSPVCAEQWEDLYKRAAAMQAQGNSGAALDAAKAALTEAEKELGADSLELSRALNLLADIHQKRGELRDAAVCLERLRAVQEAALGPRSMKVAKTVSTLISVYEKQGATQAAEDLNRLASERWGRQENADVPRTGVESRGGKAVGQPGALLDKWKTLSQTPNYAKISTLMADYHKNHQYLKEDFFVCSDMAIEVWDIIKTAGINARLMVGNVNKNIVKYNSDHEYIMEMNHVWVLAEVFPSEWIPVEATAGAIVHPNVPSFELYSLGTSFNNPRQFKQFSESRRALFQTCREANSMVTDFNSAYAGKPETREALEHTGRTKQKLEDCRSLEREVLSYLSR